MTSKFLSNADKKILEALEVVGLSKFVKELPDGLNTEIYPEGKQISNTIAKKIVLARAILKEPKLMILEDALDQFSDLETKTIIDYLSKPENPWSLVVVSNNEYWKTYCNELMYLRDGEIQIKK